VWFEREDAFVCLKAANTGGHDHVQHKQFYIVLADVFDSRLATVQRFDIIIEPRKHQRTNVALLFDIVDDQYFFAIPAKLGQINTVFMI